MKPASGHAACFREDGIGCARTLLATRVRDDAVGAELVASLDDGDVATVGITARGELGVRGPRFRLTVVEACNACFACFQADQHLRQVAVGG